MFQIDIHSIFYRNLQNIGPRNPAQSLQKVFICTSLSFQQKGIYLRKFEALYLSKRAFFIQVSSLKHVEDS